MTIFNDSFALMSRVVLDSKQLMTIRSLVVEIILQLTWYPVRYFFIPSVTL